MTTRAEATRARLQSAALDLFEERGYRAVTVEEIAAAAGVSHMTFFRHFPTKERVLLDDPFDPVIAAAVAAQPTGMPPIERIARGLVSLAPLLDQEPTAQARRAIAIAAREPDLQAGMAANTAATERAIVEAAATAGDEPAMRIAAAACLAAVTAVLLGWATDGSTRTLGELVSTAMTTVVPALAEAQVPAFARATP
ncbi:TetR/AcrR family transcriptional regulator [Demequina gelatinilytica]|uniref:TetR/AcrR family transcriptional regulator n=1 Tax=Demequina gelatinilytica TaxID=1638980 RepID=UPI0009E4E79A|nr:TetR/AcrR family transcriptional regulator [Demequina gelatinilytica]